MLKSQIQLREWRQSKHSLDIADELFLPVTRTGIKAAYVYTASVTCIKAHWERRLCIDVPLT